MTRRDAPPPLVLFRPCQGHSQKTRTQNRSPSSRKPSRRDFLLRRSAGIGKRPEENYGPRKKYRHAIFAKKRYPLYIYGGCRHHRDGAWRRRQNPEFRRLGSEIRSLLDRCAASLARR